METIIFIIIFIIGAFFGSFYSLATYRIPKGQDITHSRSYCPNCDHKLGFLDLFPILSYIFLILYWYYISMFGAIYRNTQLYLLKDTLISYGLGLIYPFGIYLLPGIIRIPSLSRQDKECLYNFSKFLQIL